MRFSEWLTNHVYDTCRHGIFGLLNVELGGGIRHARATLPDGFVPGFDDHAVLEPTTQCGGFSRGSAEH
jgi:hypothetical protein